MHILGLGLHVLIALFFAVHAIRSGRELYWLLILFMFPLLGSLVYAVAIFIPEIRSNRGLHRVVRGVQRTLDPGADLRLARAEYELSPTVANRLRFADALVAHGSPADALPHYRDCLQGVYRDDPHIEVKLARALLESGDAGAARALLEALIAREPEFRSPEGHLTYARAVAECGDREAARTEFDSLMRASATLDIPAHYAEYLVRWCETAAARTLADEALRHLPRLNRHARDVNAPWIKRLRAIPNP
jgi:hypothetical protein